MITKVNRTDYAEGDLQVAIVATDSALLISANIIDSTGYNGISLMATKNNQVISNNEVKHFCYLKNDGGGIYNGGVRGNGAGSRIYFINNTVHDAFDASDGTGLTTPHVRGIYLDATSDSVKIINNTVFNCYGGIYVANARGNIVRGNNVLYGGLNINPFFEGLLEAAYGTGYQTTINNVFTQNTIVATNSTNLIYLNTDIAGNNVDIVGTIDSNYYVNASSILTNPWAYNYGGGVTQYTFSGFKAAHPYDIHSIYFTPSLSNLRFEYNATGSNATVNLGGYNYTDKTGVTNYAGSITLAPFTSAILFIREPINKFRMTFKIP